MCISYYEITLYAFKNLDEINLNERPNNLNSFNSEEEIDIGKLNYKQKLHNKDIFIYFTLFLPLNNRSKVSISKRVGVERQSEIRWKRWKKNEKKGKSPIRAFFSEWES